MSAPYIETTTTATFRTTQDNVEAKTMKARGFLSQHHAFHYFSQQVGRVTLEVGAPVWLSNLVNEDNGDFLCEAVPRYYSEHVVEVQ